MQIRHLRIERFRGIRLLDWIVNGEVCCLLGPGDSTKTSILEAIELALSPRWDYTFDDSDFYDGITDSPIVIAATVGQLPDSLKADDRFGLEIRGWNREVGLKDEPGEGDEPVLSVRLEDVFKSYSKASSRIPWLETLSQEAWNGKSSEFLRQANRFVIFFGWAPDLPGDRKCKVAINYSEMVGPPDRLLDIQRGNFQSFIAKSSSYDLLLAHTPAEVKILEGLVGETPVALCPSGYDADVMGKPDWKAPKERDLVFYGYKAGRREEVFKQLHPHLKHKLDYIYGWYGATRHTMMNRAKAIFNVPFSFDLAYPSFRVWQAISSSAPVILEPIDCWPSEPGKHHLEIPMITPDTAKEAAAKIDSYLDNAKLLVKTAKTAHKDLSMFTIEHCLKEYLVPASAGIQRKRKTTQRVS